MQVNDTIYPVVTGGNEIVTTKNLAFSNYPAGQVLEESIVYSGSVSQFAPWRNIAVCSHAIYTGRQEQIYFFNTGDQIHRQRQNDAQRIVLQVSSQSHTGGGGDMQESIPAYGYANFSPNRTLIRGMQFNRLVGILYFFICKIAAGLADITTGGYCTYNEYVNTYKSQGYKIVSAWIGHLTAFGSGGAASVYAFPLDPIPWTKYIMDSGGSMPRVNGEGKMLVYCPEAYRLDLLDTANRGDSIPVFNCPNVGRQSYIAMDAIGTLGQYTNPNAIDGYNLMNNRYYAGGVWIVGAIQDADIAHVINAYGSYRAPMLYVTDENIILKMASTYGIMFTLDGTLPTFAQLNTPDRINNLYIPFIDDTGSYSGNGATGNSTNPPTIPPLTASMINGAPTAPYNGGFPKNYDRIDPNVYTDHIDLGKPTITANSVFNRSFVVNLTNVQALADWLYSANDTLWDEIIHGLGLMGEQPIQGIISLRLYPFEITAKMPSITTQYISIGRTESPVIGYLLDNNSECVFDLGECKFFEYFGNFLDYSPYTTAEMYIPFIGKFPIDTEIFMGHNISVKLIADYQTGAATAVVFCDEIPVIYKSGVIGIDIPVTADNAAAYAQNVVSGIVGTIPQIVRAAEGIATGNAVDTISGTVGMVGGIYNAFAHPTQYQTAGATAPQTALYQPLKAYFTVYKPVTAEPENYNNAVGYATEQTVTIGNCAGWSVFANPDLNGIPATATEIAEIQSLLSTGIFV